MYYIGMGAAGVEGNQQGSQLRSGQSASVPAVSSTSMGGAQKVHI